MGYHRTRKGPRKKAEGELVVGLNVGDLPLRDGLEEARRMTESDKAQAHLREPEKSHRKADEKNDPEEPEPGRAERRMVVRPAPARAFRHDRFPVPRSFHGRKHWGAYPRPSSGE